jgi:murein peptide amidase A
MRGVRRVGPLARLWLTTAVLVACSPWLGCDSGDSPAGNDTRGTRSNGRETNQRTRPIGPVRLSVELPQGWRTLSRPLTELTNPAEVLRLASVRLGRFQAGRNCSPGPALARLPRGETLILLLHRSGGLGFARRLPGGPPPRRVRLTGNTLDDHECAGHAHSIYFRRRGLSFQAWVYFRPPRGTASERRVAERVLNSIEVERHARPERVESRAGPGPPHRDAGRIGALSGALEAPVGRERDDPFTVGRTAEGRAIRALALNGLSGELGLAFGCIHGDECAGIRLRRVIDWGSLPATDFVLVPNLNPDGFARGTRVNARGVDLNRNFPAGWRPRGAPGDPEYPGRAPLSEPETRVAVRLIRRLDPAVTVWFHQQAEPLVRAWGPSVPAARRYARSAGLPFHRLPWLPGSAPNWQNHLSPPAASFVVELAPGPLSRAEAFDHAAAVLAASRLRHD